MNSYSCLAYFLKRYGFQPFISFICLCFLMACAARTGLKPITPNAQITPPVLVKKAEPFYPANCRLQGMEGDVKMYLFVTETGEVDRIKIISSSGYSELDTAAQQYARLLEFTPAIMADKPVAIWLSWVVQYTLFDGAALFDMNSYVARIQNLTEAAIKADGEEKENLLSEMIKIHESYFNFMLQNPAANMNNRLEPVLDQSVIQQWQEYWQQWPLTFVVLQEFDLRFHETKLKSYAIDLQIKQIVSDLERASKTDSEKKDSFYQAIYQYLKQNYPKVLENSRKADLQLYLDY